MYYYLADCLVSISVVAYLAGFHVGGFVAWLVLSQLPQPETKDEPEVDD